MDGEEYEAKKGFGYLAQFGTTDILCSVALIDLETVIADASFLPEGTDISKIYAVFRQIFNPTKPQISFLCMPEYITEEETNVTLVVLSVSSSTN